MNTIFCVFFLPDCSNKSPFSLLEHRCAAWICGGESAGKS